MNIYPAPGRMHLIWHSDRLPGDTKGAIDLAHTGIETKTTSSRPSFMVKPRADALVNMATP
jgi:hypothetical protein